MFKNALGMYEDIIISAVFTIWALEYIITVYRWFGKKKLH